MVNRKQMAIRLCSRKQFLKVQYFHKLCSAIPLDNTEGGGFVNAYLGEHK